MMTFDEAARKLDEFDQGHVLGFWEESSAKDRARLLGQLGQIDFPLISRLTKEWVLGTPPSHRAADINPVEVIPPVVPDRSDAINARDAGEAALRAGRVGLVLVAGGQGTRLGFDGPKGTFPIGPVSGRTLFEFHADKIRNLQRRYGRTLPWYIMVGETNEEATREYFREKDFFGLDENDVRFFRQRMMPCVDEDGKFLLESKASLAMNPNGHGGAIPALVENGILKDAQDRGIDTLSYFQVDNWAGKLADPYFIGYHLLRNGEMSSKVKRKITARESSGVFCRCDGKARVIEYTELDIYPQLLESDAEGNLLHFAANAAIHVIDVGFIERVYARFSEFPWHCSHKKIAYVEEGGTLVSPDEPNGYKFETFIFDALVYAENEAVMLEIQPEGEFTPTKQMSGPGSVEESRKAMARYWGGWLKAAGCTTPLEGIEIEISPDFAFSEEEFIERAKDLAWPESGPIVIGPDGAFL